MAMNSSDTFSAAKLFNVMLLHVLLMTCPILGESADTEERIVSTDRPEEVIKYLAPRSNLFGNKGNFGCDKFGVYGKISINPDVKLSESIVLRPAVIKGVKCIWYSESEISNRQWERVVDPMPEALALPGEGKLLPKCGFSHREALEFCKKN